MLRAKSIIKILDNWAKPYLIDNWDNTGFQIGNPNKDVKKILLALDLDNKVLEKAKEIKTDMIITHHPIIFKPLTKITTTDYQERLIYDIIKEGIVVYNAHTNLDLANGGVNDILAELLGLEDVDVLNTSYIEPLYKIVVYVPKSHSHKVRSALGEAGAGWVGNYSHCTYNSKGIGTFMPRDGTNPFIGETNKLEKVNEVKIETIMEDKNLKKVLNKMIKVHPYEEVAYDIYPLKNKGKEYGYGRVGNIKEMLLSSFLDLVKERLDVNPIKVYGYKNKDIKRVAICGGSGASFINDAYKKNADVYVTGDIKYHDAQLGHQLGLVVVDANHYDTEKIILSKLKDYIHDNIQSSVEVIIHKESSPTVTLY